MAASVKMPVPYQTGALFLLAVAFTSLPAYKEGFAEIRNDIFEGSDSSYLRRFGLYCFIGGYAILAYKNKGSIPFIGPGK